MSSQGNKVHIYSVLDLSLKHCISEDIPISKILNFSFSKKNKFLCYLFDDLTMQIYNLANENVKLHETCQCTKSDKERKSLLNNLFTNIKVINVKFINQIINPERFI